jgi:hypothetical protein
MAMLLAEEPVRQIAIPRKLVTDGVRDRRLTRRLQAIATLRRAGQIVEPTFTDDQGALVTDEQAEPLRARVEPQVRELARGRAAHARQTIAVVEASRKSGPEQVDDLLDAVYRSHAQGERSKRVLDAFLDTFERWQNPAGVPRIELLFARVDLARAPEATGLLLLATTRLTRTQFVNREAFIERLRGFLVGRGGRTEQQVDGLLRGLRE